MDSIDPNNKQVSALMLCSEISRTVFQIPLKTLYKCYIYKIRGLRVIAQREVFSVVVSLLRMIEAEL